MRPRISVVAAAVAAVTATTLATLPASAAGGSDVHVVHGIPGVTVDVYANDGLLLEDFAPGTRTDAVPLDAGDYVIEVFAANADPDADTAVITQTVAVPAGDLDIDLVAHYAADGTPGLSAFVNDLSTTGDDRGRVVVRHTAEAPAVDVRAGGAVLFGNLANPDEAAGEVPPATYSVDIAAAGAADAVFGPIDLVVAEGVETTVYAVGTLGDDFGVLAFTSDVGARDTSRLAGDNRILTAIEIAQRAFPDGADVVYLARSDIFVDAVAGGVLTDGPILLVPTCGDLPEAVATELGRLDPDEVIALGGGAAICDAMLAAAGAAS